jgi:hypothetical protein
MQAAERPLAEVYETLSTALDELDRQGEAMAALHLAMAVDCLASCICDDGECDDGEASLRPKERPVLRLIRTP